MNTVVISVKTFTNTNYQDPTLPRVPRKGLGKGLGGLFGGLAKGLGKIFDPSGMASKFSLVMIVLIIVMTAMRMMK